MSVMILQDQQTSGTGGGSATTGSWETRTLNTVVLNDITGASLASNVVTLPAGEYRAEFVADHLITRETRTRLYDVTNDVVLGMSVNVVARSEPTSNTKGYAAARGRCQFTLAGEADVELQSQVTHAIAGGSGIHYGKPASFGTEVYVTLYITRND